MNIAGKAGLLATLAYPMLDVPIRTGCPNKNAKSRQNRVHIEAQFVQNRQACEGSGGLGRYHFRVYSRSGSLLNFHTGLGPNVRGLSEDPISASLRHPLGTSTGLLV